MMQHRCFAPRRPGGPHRREEREARLVLEDDPRPPAAGRPFMRGHSTSTQLGMASSLRSRARRAGALTGPAQPLAQKLPGLGLAVPHPGGRLDHIGHPGQGPQIGREPVRPRPLPEGGHHIAELVVADLGTATRPACSRQRRPPSTAPQLVPLRCRLGRNPQRPGDLGLALTPTEHARRPHPPEPQRLAIPAVSTWSDQTTAPPPCVGGPIPATGPEGPRREHDLSETGARRSPNNQRPGIM
jgi:hypothetical protein